MKVRFTAPTEANPFFANVKVETKDGWRRVKMQSPVGWISAVFPNQAEMIKGVKAALR